MSAPTLGKYVGGRESLGPRGKDVIGEAISSTLQNLGGAFGKDQKRQSLVNTLMNDKSSPLQKALALGDLGHDQIGASYLKSAMDQQNRDFVNAYETNLNNQIRDLEGNPQKTAPVGSQQNTVPENTPPVGNQQYVPQQVLDSIFGGQQQVSLNNGNVVPPVRNDLEVKAQKAKLYDDASLKFANIDIPLSNKYANLANQEKKDIRNSEKVDAMLYRADIKKEQDERKETQPYVDKILDAYQGSKTTAAALDKMQNLAENRELTSPALATLMGKMGINLGVLNNPDSEEFDKLSNTLTRDITKFYGTRLNISEFQNFLRQIPTLMNSEEGRLRVINNLKHALMPATFEYDAYKEIMKENQGKRPLDIREQVIERMEPLLEQWGNALNKDLGSLEKLPIYEVPSGHIAMKKPDGVTIAVPFDKIEEALANKATIVNRGE